MALLDFWRTWRAKRRQLAADRVALHRGIEELVELVDPRLRGMPGYRSRLAPALQHAVKVADALVAGLSDPLWVDRRSWSQQPLLRAYFTSADVMQEILDNSNELRDFLTSAAARGADEVYAAMGMRMTRSTSLQTELKGDVLLRDQQRTVVTFSDHRLGAFAIDQESFKKSLRRRLLEEIAMRAMQRIMGLRTQREALQEEKTRLQWKLKMYQKQSDGIGGLWHDQGRLERHIQGLEEQLGDTREGLQDLLTRAGDIEDFLDTTAEALQNIDQTVSMDWHTLYVDAMNVEASPEAGRSGLSLCAIRIGRRQPRIVQLIKFSPDFVSVDTGKALRRAARALGVH
ncbi:MAG: hypothetical protein WBN68_04360 [Sedimenticolaceae bacterium]